MIARLAMVRIAKRSVKSHDHKGLCTPYAEEYLAKELEDAAEVKVHRSTNKMLCIVGYVVRLITTLGFIRRRKRFVFHNLMCLCTMFYVLCLVLLFMLLLQFPQGEPSQ